MTLALTPPELMAGPPLDGGTEHLEHHLARLGYLPQIPGTELIEAIEDSELFGRGGAGFPVGRKWRCLAERPSGRAAVLVNGAEGEPLSQKDRVLMTHRPHLVLDGAALAARAIGADEVIVYVGTEHGTAIRAMASAIAERSLQRSIPGDPEMRLVRAPAGYVAGEATAAVHFVNAGDARPTGPPRVSERGVDGAPTLVQNVESLAWTGLIARRGPAWYRALGRGAPGSALVTVAGDVAGGSVRELPLGTTLRALLQAIDIDPRELGAVLLGGYFGSWASSAAVLDLPLEPTELRRAGLTFGCGLIAPLRADRCGLRATARSLSFLAAESAGQCGPCVWGLRSIAETFAALVAGAASRNASSRLELWASLVTGRGACHHPDGAAQLLRSALDVFGEDVEAHARGGLCAATNERPRAAA